eukprot:8635853-Ditylum_brightwellii.AAC.1
MIQGQGMYAKKYPTIGREAQVNCGWATNCLSSSSGGEKEEELTGNKQKKNIEQNDSKTLFEFETKRHCFGPGDEQDVLKFP